MKLTERIAAEAAGDVPFPFGRESDGAGRETERSTTMLVSTPTSDDSHAKRMFFGFDLATGPDMGCFYVAFVHADGRLDFVPLDEPTGHIIVDGEPMAFWLPPGISAESIGISETGVDGRLRGHDGERG